MRSSGVFPREERVGCGRHDDLVGNPPHLKDDIHLHRPRNIHLTNEGLETGHLPSGSPEGPHYLLKSLLLLSPLHVQFQGRINTHVQVAPRLMVQLGNRDKSDLTVLC